MLKWVVFFTLLLISIPASGQNQSSLKGKVVSDSGQVLYGANVVLRGQVIEGSRGTTTDEQGKYYLTNIPAGEYEVTISYLGYETITLINLTIRSSQETIRNIKLFPTTLVGQQYVVSASRKPEKVLDAPASVEVVDSQKIRDSQALAVNEHIKGLGGVDYAKTGVVQASTVIRGFNNALSGLLLTMVDNRIARIPSLRINSFHTLPIISEDIEQIEIVRGPGSALYGPNSSNGVMHIISRSPFDSEGNFLSLSGGERGLLQASFRHASILDEKVAMKISGKYLTARDWEYHDPEEVIPRNFNTEGLYGEMRLDIRPTKELTFINSGGFSKSSSIQMTGQGSAQGKDWVYGYLQSRVSYKGWFGQIFYNKSDAGSSKLLRTGESVVDKSSLTVMQLQHTSEINKNQHLIYGVDLLLTRPKTEGTIHGPNENNDNTNEYGVYLQSETKFNEQLSLMFAGRLDKHNRLENPVFSPRAALVLKPNPASTFRLTYNRAFDTPTVTTFSLDLKALSDVFELGSLFGNLGLDSDNTIDLRSYGAAEGFTFHRDETGLPMYRSPFSITTGSSRDTYLPLNDQSSTNVLWRAARDLLVTEMVNQLGEQSDGLVTPELAEKFTDIIPSQLVGLKNSLGLLDSETRDFNPYDVLSLRDIPQIKPTITQTLEVGYKGFLNRNFAVSADIYLTQMKNYTLPLLIFTPSVFLEASSLQSALTQSIANHLANPDNAELALLVTLLDQNSLGGNGNGDHTDEVENLISMIVSGAAMIPFGTITPEQASDPTAVALTYKNFGKVSVYGFDLGASYFPNRSWQITGNYSYLHENLFRNVENQGDVPLNAPKHKFNGGVIFQPRGKPLSLGTNVSYRGSFPMIDGVYAGPVDSYTLIDAHATYEFPLVTLRLEASNLFNKKYRSFVGAPYIGRLLSAGLAFRF